MSREIKNEANEMMTAVDGVYQQMLVKNAIKNRIIDMNEVFNETSCYKLNYYLEKIERIDDLKNTPMKEREPITIRINSTGGAVYELFNVLATIERLQKRGYKIHAYAGGKVMSCGLILFVSADKRIVSRFSTLLYHSVSSYTAGKLVPMEEDIEEVKRLNEFGKEFIKEKTGVDVDEVYKDKTKYSDIFISGKEAFELGLATDMI